MVKWPGAEENGEVSLERFVFSTLCAGINYSPRTRHDVSLSWLQPGGTAVTNVEIDYRRHKFMEVHVRIVKCEKISPPTNDLSLYLLLLPTRRFFISAATRIEISALH